MGELARRRRSRELSISRGHLWAAGVAVLVLVTTSFVVGSSLSGAAPEPARAAPQALNAQVADEQLIDLLARVEASADPHGGVAELTFPDALARSEVAASPPALPPAEMGGAQVALAPPTVGLPVGDVLPAGSWTIDVALVDVERDAHQLADDLRAQGLAAWVGPQHLDGVTRFRVAVGSFEAEAPALTHVDEVSTVLSALNLPYSASPRSVHP